MSDTSLRRRPEFYSGVTSRYTTTRSPGRSLSALPNLNPTRSFASLPYDILLIISSHLEPDEAFNLGRTCKSLHDFSRSRAIWLSFAVDMLNSSRPLPLDGFQRIKDLDATELANLIRKGHRLHHVWRRSNPKLVRPYDHISVPRHEDVVWLSVITTKYTLCCTRTGRVLCWDIGKGECISSWSSGADWEIWKCRVEFEERMVYFAMAKRGANGIGTDCQLMALHFPKGRLGADDEPPFFTMLSNFCFPGHVISIYLLDPLRRLLSAYIWIRRTNQLGLYILLDWSIPLYVFLNTGISCEPIREWTCLGYYQDNVVIHAEDEDHAYQFLYPYNFLRVFATRTPPSLTMPMKLPLAPPPLISTEDFIHTTNPFEGKYLTQSSHFVRQWWPTVPNFASIRRWSCTIVLRTWTVPDTSPNDLALGPDDPPPGTHLFTIAQHYFCIPLRKEHLRWWFIREPIEIVCYPNSLNQGPQDDEIQMALPPELQQLLVDPAHEELDDASAANNDHQWNVDQQGNLAQDDPVATFEDADSVGADGEEEEEEEEEEDQPALPVPPPHPAPDPLSQELSEGEAVNPLVAVDFSCAVWLEYVSFTSDDLRVRYVVFPPVDMDRTAADYEGLSREHDVHTLEVPPEIDLRQVCHIGIDQAQGTIILGMRRSNVYVLRYG